MTEKEKLETQVKNLRDILYEQDMEALSLILQKDDIVEEIKPLNSALMNIDYKLKDLSQQKDMIMRQVGKAIALIIALEDTKHVEGYIG